MWRNKRIVSLSYVNPDVIQVFKDLSVYGSKSVLVLVAYYYVIIRLSRKKEVLLWLQ